MLNKQINSSNTINQSVFFEQKKLNDKRTQEKSFFSIKLGIFDYLI